jgi:hypothetical protein
MGGPMARSSNRLIRRARCLSEPRSGHSNHQVMKAFAGVLIGLSAAGLIVGCGSTADEGGLVMSGGNGASSGGPPSSPSSQAGSLALMPGGSASGGNGTLGNEMACATGTASAKLSNVRMLVMFDRSTSMNDEADQTTGATRWDLASAALTGFFADPAAGGLQVALRFFPHDSPAAGCNDDACDVNACAQPIVPLATLAAEPADAHEAALVAASIAAMPPPRMAGQGANAGSQGTPISAALGGALSWAAGQRMAAPEESAVVVLVTDGQPNGCEEEITAISGLAQEAFTTSGIRTYAIGLTGSRESDMDAIAAAGGTTEGIFISDGATAKQDLLNALAAIRGSVLDCDFEMPNASNGMQVDPSKVNVKYTPAGGTQMTLGRVPDEAGCGTAPGWYYDNEMNPTRIMLCPASCNSASVEVDATLEVLLGCVTETREPA